MKSKIGNIIIKVSVVFICVGFIQISCQSSGKSNDVEGVSPLKQKDVNTVFYLTKPDKSTLFTKQISSILPYKENDLLSIKVSTNERYQEIDGFGYSLTGGSALHINKMSSFHKKKLLNELFSIDEGIGVSYLRVSIGASDLDKAPFSYNDLPLGQTDVNMINFSIDKDKEHLIPILKEILAINPDIKIIGSPWSPPVWMKTNESTIGGRLKPEYYKAYARYFVKYIEAMSNEGIIIDAITIQNEPLNTTNNPSLYMSAREQIEFIKNYLGPMFEMNKISTKIIIYDHNADRIDYPITILNDSEAKKYIDGSAFHLYGGNINNLSKVKDAHPDKNLYFTEQWTGINDKFEESLRWHTKELLIGATRNWCRVVLEWNLASNSYLEPHTQGGCTECLGALTIDGNTVTKNIAYYVIAHASKFVRPKSIRIGSNYIDVLPNVAFETPKGEIVVIVLNDTKKAKTFNIKFQYESITTTLPPGAIGTYINDSKSE